MSKPSSAVICGLSTIAVLLSGCRLAHLGGDMVIGPVYAPSNIYGAGQPLPPEFRRVAVLPLHCAASSSEPGQAVLDVVLREELGKVKRFEVLPLSAEELVALCGARTWTDTRPLPRELLAAAREKLGCDGILFSELTQFQPYPPLSVGWSLKLVDARTGQILWAADEVFDAGQPSVANGARLYQLDRPGLSRSLADSRVALISPTAFGHYSAQCLFTRLPHVSGPQLFSPLTDKQAETVPSS